MRLGASFALNARRRRGTGGVPASTTLAIGLMGQSECVFIMSPASTYNKLVENGFSLPQNVPSGILTMYTQEANGGAVVTTPVTQANVNAGLVNPAMAAMACFLGYVRPGYQFHVGDLALSGTGRNDLASDAESTRLWSDFTLVQDAVEAGAARPLDLLLECWYRNDIAAIPTFTDNFWPFYFGSTAAGANFTLGTANPVSGVVIDHCLYDAQVAASSEGRGVLARGVTDWSVLTPMSDIFAYPVAPTAEATNFTAFSPFGAPVRQTIIDLSANSLAQSARITAGPSAHITRFDAPGGTNGGPTHPTTANPDGQIGFMWPFAVAIARKAGLAINEPVYDSVQADPAGAWVDVYFTLPNGGNLTTWRILESRAAGSSSVPHRQQAIGFEVGRAGSYRPVFNTAETSYPANTRGTVTIEDTGSGSPRKGRIRITPAVPFAFGDSVRYLAGGASAVLQTPRDIGVHADMLVETIPSLRDVAATYPFPGVAVRPQQADVLVPVTPPAFTARAVYFDGGDYFSNEAATVPATSNFMASVWFRSADSSWNATARRLVQLRVGTTITFEILTSSSGRLSIRLNNNTASDVLTIFADGGSTQFVTGQWYHLMISTAGGAMRAYVNGVLAGTLSYTTIDQSGQNITRVGFAAQTSGTGPWLGDIGHLWLAANQALDLTVAANREKFALAGVPVDLGPTGALPTGTQPQFYFDGAGAAWQNLGSVGSVPATGAVAATFTAPTSPAY